MHRCWLIPEIVCMICEQVDVEDINRPTLAVLARTAKIFQYSLDLLWREQHNLLPLLKCMPLDLWEIEECADQPEVFVNLRRPALPSDLDRLLFYSHRVKLFIVQGGTNVAADALRACLADQTLFPNVLSVVWKNPESLGDLPLYLGPSLKHLGLALNDSAPHLFLLSTLTRQYPILKSIDICLPTSPSTTEGVSEAICGLRALNRLTANTLTPAALLHIGKLPHLNVLNLATLGDIRVPETLPEERFVRLQHMSVGAGTIEQCTALLRFFSAAPLRTAFFALDATDQSSADAWAAFASALCDHCVHRALQTIFLYHGTPPIPEFGSHAHILAPPTGAALVPLLAFTHLRSLVLEPPYGLTLDEGVLRDMACAWPHIEKLVLGVSGASVSVRTLVTLRALLPFALHCPHLRTLGVVLDATLPLDTALDATIDAEAERSSIKSASGHRALRRLLLGPSVIRDADVPGVARLLAEVFPHLGAMVCSRGYEREGVWRRVGVEMSRLLSVRAGEEE
ncbi:hypothetical protein B0H13DRAFT_2024090 [Mycena leptocephala]|nr:hypothetical protein B0H13DRAFT_2024090 [Mycena leptocephala]